MKILIVDDSKMLRYMTSDVLKTLGYNQFFEASDVPEAKAKLCKEKIDLVISDFHMPLETGLDLLKWVRASPDFAGMPFIMLTTDGEKKTIISIVQAGVQAYLLKPVQAPLMSQKLLELSRKFGFPPPKEG